jgi:hypothetical protein
VAELRDRSAAARSVLTLLEVAELKRQAEALRVQSISAQTASWWCGCDATRGSRSSG